MLESLFKTITSIAAILSLQLGLTAPPENFSAEVQPIAGTTYTLSGAGVSSSATSITLSTLTIPQTGQKLQDSDFSTTFYVTLEPGNRSRQELVSCTTVTQNGNGSATLSGCTRGLAPITPFTASSTLQFAHSGGSQVIFSDPPQLFNQYPAKANDETITGQWTFSTFPVTPSNSTASETVAGVAEIATGAEAAASTQDGGVGRLVLPATLATSTYSTSTSPNRVIVTNSAGVIDSKFLGTSTVLVRATTTVQGSFFVASSSATSVSNIASSSIVSFLSSTTPSTNWTKPANLKYIVVEIISAGGGGGGCTDIGRAGGGGGGGGYARKIIAADKLGSTEAVVVPTGGSAGAAGAAGGTNAVSAAFGSHVTVTNGSGGDVCAAGAAAGGAGGAPTGGDINITGGKGGRGASDAALASGLLSVGGHGGSTPYGFGAGINVINSTSVLAGEAGAQCGGGGSGGANANSANDAVGGAGGVGCVFVTQVFF